MGDWHWIVLYIFFAVVVWELGFILRCLIHLLGRKS